MSASARRAREARPRGHRPAIAVAGDVDPKVLTATGWRVTGRLPVVPYDDPRDTAAYADLAELLDDPRVDAVALDGAQPRLAAALPALRRAGLLVVLASPAPLEVELLQAAVRVPLAPAVFVGFLQREEPWARTVAAALPLAAGPVLQVTVRGWPRGEGAAAELVDLAVGWGGPVVAVAAAPEALPVSVLPSGERVAWSLLTESGATVLVSADGGPSLVRLSFPSARLEAGPLGARWVGGAELPLPAARRPPGAVLPGAVPPGAVPPGTPAGLLAAVAAALAAVPYGGELPSGGLPRPGPPADAADLPRDDGSRPADLGRLLHVARVLHATRESARRGCPVRTD